MDLAYIITATLLNDAGIQGNYLILHILVPNFTCPIFFVRPYFLYVSVQRFKFVSNFKSWNKLLLLQIKAFVILILFNPQTIDRYKDGVWNLRMILRFHRYSKLHQLEVFQSPSIPSLLTSLSAFRSLELIQFYPLSLCTSRKLTPQEAQDPRSTSSLPP